jgi:hypothetical protein
MDILCFKEKKDLELWRYGHGTEEIRRRITWANIYSLQIVGHSATVTAWFKSGPFHENMMAFDLRIRGYTPEELDRWRNAMWNDKIPCHLLKDHFHVGELATLKYERE